MLLCYCYSECNRMGKEIRERANEIKVEIKKKINMKHDLLRLSYNWYNR